MGGFVRAIRRVFTRPQQVVVQQPAPQPATPAQTTTPAKTSSAMAANNAGAYGGSTIMTGASGVEDEANVSKTILGGGKKKKVKA